MTAAAVLQRPNQHDAVLLVDAADLQLRLREDRFAACPAELPELAPSELCPRVRS